MELKRQLFRVTFLSDFILHIVASLFYKFSGMISTRNFCILTFGFWSE